MSCASDTRADIPHAIAAKVGAAITCSVLTLQSVAALVAGVSLGSFTFLFWFSWSRGVRHPDGS